MKQATNLFSKGLSTDFDPLNCPDDILTDNLNGTIITMNGSEGVLLNDMGNAKVYYDNLSVKLNDGFVPVGVKEYGGIIYIASYNPKTNESEIGSFPSPSYEIQKLEYDGVSLKNIFTENDCIKEKKILLFNGNLLYPGDKFTITLDSKDIDIKKFKKHYTGEGEEKNKKYNLKLAVLDFTNNLITIPSDLLNFKFSLSEDDLGDKYFFNKEQIYLNKFSGKLYLVVSKNLLDHIDVRKEIITNELGLVNLYFYVSYYYNCPDFEEQANQIPTQNVNPNIEYYEWLSNTLVNLRGRLKVNNAGDSWPTNFKLGSEYILEFPRARKNDYPSYDGDTGLFKYTIKYKIPINSSERIYSNPEGNISVENYSNSVWCETGESVILGCKLTFIDNGNNIFKYIISPRECELSLLSLSGSINFNLIGTNSIVLDTWKYYVENDITTLTTGFTEYFDTDVNLKEIKIKIYKYSKLLDLKEKLSTLELNKENVINPGDKEPDYVVSLNSTETLNTDIELTLGDIYYCYIYYKTNKDNNNYKLYSTRWLINTTLFNGRSNSDYEDLLELDIPVQCDIKVKERNTGELTLNKIYVKDSEASEYSESDKSIIEYSKYKKLEYKKEYDFSLEKSIDHVKYPNIITVPEKIDIQCNNTTINNLLYTATPTIYITDNSDDEVEKTIYINKVFINISDTLKDYWTKLNHPVAVFKFDEKKLVCRLGNLEISILPDDVVINYSGYCLDDYLFIDTSSTFTNDNINPDYSDLNSVFTIYTPTDSSTPSGGGYMLFAIKTNSNIILLNAIIPVSLRDSLSLKDIYILDPTNSNRTINLRVHSNDLNFNYENDKIIVGYTINDTIPDITLGNDLIKFKYLNDDNCLSIDTYILDSFIYNEILSNQIDSGYVINNQIKPYLLNPNKTYIYNDGTFTEIDELLVKDRNEIYCDRYNTYRVTKVENLSYPICKIGNYNCNYYINYKNILNTNNLNSNNLNPNDLIKELNLRKCETYNGTGRR